MHANACAQCMQTACKLHVSCKTATLHATLHATLPGQTTGEWRVQAVYLEAFRRLYALLEESGWRIGKEGEKVAEEQSLDQLGYLAG